MTTSSEHVLYCDDCYAVRGYGFCPAHQYLWRQPPAVDEIRPQGERPKTRRLTVYVERSKEANWRIAEEEIWPDQRPDHDQSRRAFSYTLLEAPVEIEVDLSTGRARALSFAGVPLQQPTDWGL